jgi:hypothetical protein
MTRTTRRRRRGRRWTPARTALAAATLVLVLIGARTWALFALAALVGVAAAAFTIARPALERYRRPVTRAQARRAAARAALERQLAAEQRARAAAEHAAAGLRDQLATLERQLADARASAAAAWDAAAERPPTPPRPADAVADARARLLSSPRSGARPLVGGP